MNAASAVISSSENLSAPSEPNYPAVIIPGFPLIRQSASNDVINSEAPSLTRGFDNAGIGRESRATRRQGRNQGLVNGGVDPWGRVRLKFAATLNSGYILVQQDLGTHTHRETL